RRLAEHGTHSQPALMSTSVDIGNVTLTYRSAGGGVLALRDTSLNVPRGEFAAVVGPSGCGKSSLMKIVTGLVPPDSGDIVIFGDRVRGPVKIAGMAFQNPNLLPWRKVIDNVLLPLEIVEPHRRKFRRERQHYRDEAEALLKTVDLPRPRDLDICFEPHFTAIVHELRAKIAEVRKP